MIIILKKIPNKTKKKRKESTPENNAIGHQLEYEQSHGLKFTPVIQFRNCLRCLQRSRKLKRLPAGSVEL